MSRTLIAAAVQMRAEPALVAERLLRATALIEKAAGKGAQLVVLPEVFNTGYEYSPANFQRAEQFDGESVTWMKSTAARLGVHVAGSLLLCDRGELYNSMLLVSPEGRTWRYDKNYPWMWERAYFRPGQGVTIADTDLGKFGLLVCWDVAHIKLWAAYAGQVQAMLVSSCPPKVFDLTLILPDGKRLNNQKDAWFMRPVLRNAPDTFGKLLKRQVTSLCVPAVCSSACGRFSSTVPAPALTLAPYFLALPRLWQHQRQAASIHFESGFFEETYICDAAGRALNQAEPGVESFALAQIDLPAGPPHTREKRPAFGLPPFPYWMDAVTNLLLRNTYKRYKNLLYSEKS